MRRKGDERETGLQHILRLPAVQHVISNDDEATEEAARRMESLLQAEASAKLMGASSATADAGIPDKVWESLGMRSVGDTSERCGRGRVEEAT
eukprot:177196-Hanusia_phi.AAC.2